MLAAIITRMTRYLIYVVFIIACLTSCYKIEYEISDDEYSDSDVITFTVNGGGYDTTINATYGFQTYSYDPATNITGSKIFLNYNSNPSIEIFLYDHVVNTYTINGNDNRAYLYTESIVGDAISGTVAITKQTGTAKHEGSFTLVFRDNAINPSDTIYVQGTYSINQ